MIAIFAKWAASVISADEVWSLRLAALQLIGAVVASVSVTVSISSVEKEVVKEMVALGVRSVIRGLTDAKYSKVRLGALNSLLRMLTGDVSGRLIKENHSDEVDFLLKFRAVLV
jgi:hypothetical protein